MQTHLPTTDEKLDQHATDNGFDVLAFLEHATNRIVDTDNGPTAPIAQLTLETADAIAILEAAYNELFRDITR